MPKPSKKDVLAFLKGCTDKERDALMKGEDDEDDPEVDPNAQEDEDEEDEEDEMDKSVLADGLLKSLQQIESLQGIPDATPMGERVAAATDIDLAKSMDATGFVQGLVDASVAHADDVGHGLAEVAQHQAVTNTALLANGRLTLALTKSLDAVDGKLTELLSRLGAPAAPRSIAPSGSPAPRSFGGPAAPPDNRLTKSQVTEMLLAAQREAAERGDKVRNYALSKSLTDYDSTGRLEGVGLEVVNAHLRKAG